MNFELHHGDCLEVMRTLSDASVDCVLTDPPYGTTACKWDSVIPFEPMWKELKRIAKPKAAICLFGSQPFTSALVMSNPKMFRYEWIWQKNAGSNFAVTDFQPMKEHESILIFGTETPLYRPIKQKRSQPIREGYTNTSNTGRREAYGSMYNKGFTVTDGWFRVPSSVQLCDRERGEHPTQKPRKLLRYFIRTYTQEGETVLDFTMGSGSTGVACELENRKFIGIEKDENYFNIAKERIEGVKKREPLFMEAAA